MPSFYQSDLFKELAALGEVDLQVIYSGPLPPERLGLGWQQDLSGFTHEFLSKQHPLKEAMSLASAQRDRLHIVNGIWAEPSFAAALVTMLLQGSKYAIYSEAPNSSESRPRSRKLGQQIFGKAIVRRATGLLPISYLAVDFFRRLGARESQLYPFGYFRKRPQRATGIAALKRAERIDVVFAGQLIRRKGLDLLIEAMRPLFAEYPSLTLTLIGGGAMQPELERQIAAWQLASRITFAGTLTSDAIQERMAAADVVVLPSRWDGWGLVVNEAFSVGVPVILSDRCGASEIVRNGVNGYVFRHEDVADLRRCLRKFLAEQARWPDLRAKSAMIGAKLSTESAAPYLVTCLEHMLGAHVEQPTPPWLLPGPRHELAV